MDNIICEGPQMNSGWICPKCGAAVSPDQKVCPNCSRNMVYTVSDNECTTITKSDNSTFETTNTGDGQILIFS